MITTQGHILCAREDYWMLQLLTGLLASSLPWVVPRHVGRGPRGGDYWCGFLLHYCRGQTLQQNCTGEIETETSSQTWRSSSALILASCELFSVTHLLSLARLFSASAVRWTGCVHSVVAVTLLVAWISPVFALKLCPCLVFDIVAT